MADYESDQETAQPSAQAPDQGQCCTHSRLNAQNLLAAKLRTLAIAAARLQTLLNLENLNAIGSWQSILQLISLLLQCI